MTNDQDRIITVDRHSAARRNRRNMWTITAVAVLGAAVLAGIFLVPRADVVESQLNRELTQGTAVPPPQRQGDNSAAQVLAGAHGTTIVFGEVPDLEGLDTSLSDLANATDPSQFQGTILVRNAEVQTVPGDQVFSIGLTKGQAVIVKIVEPTQPGPMSEHALVVRPGQKVAVSGTIQKLPPLKSWGITGYEAGELGNTAIYIQANTVQILSR